MGNEALAADSRFATNKNRLKHEGLKVEIQSCTSQHTSAEIVERLEAHKVPRGPVLTIREILVDPQLRHREFFAKLTHPMAGTVEFAGSPVRLSRTPARVKTPSPNARSAHARSNALVGEVGR